MRVDQGSRTGQQSQRSSRSWKLTLGKLADAWTTYPATRAALSNFPPGPPIFVTGTHRSGTTWVSKMLAVPGLWHVHEPFSPLKGAWPETFTYLRPDGEAPNPDFSKTRKSSQLYVI